MNVSAIMKNLKNFSSIVHKPGQEAFYVIKGIWVLPLITVVIYAVSGMFIESVRIRAVVSAVLSVFPWIAIMRKFYAQSRKHLRTQLLVLLQVLCTSVSGGYSIEKSLTLIRPVIEHTFGRRCILVKPLINLENNLKLHIGLEKALMDFATQINYQETLPVFHALAISGEIGNNTLAILRSSCQMLSEMNSVQSEIAATNAGKNAEAAMLCVMPFAITFALGNMSREYLELAKSTKTGATLLAAAFGICIIAAALLFRFMSHDSGRKLRQNVSIGYNDSLKVSASHPYSSLIKRIMPAGFLASRHELFNELSVNADLAYEQYLKKTTLTCIAATVVGASVLYSLGKNPFLAVFLTIAMYLLNSRDVKSEVDLKREDLMQDIPLFMCLICTLLEAGMQLPKAIDICSKAFGDNKNLSLEIKNIRAMMLSGISASDAVENFSLRIQIPEAQAALLLVARYGRLGTSEVLNLLHLQASSCWNLCRNAARKKQEREALGLLFPMTLDFVSVLIVATTPAIISLGI